MTGCYDGSDTLSPTGTRTGVICSCPLTAARGCPPPPGNPPIPGSLCSRRWAARRRVWSRTRLPRLRCASAIARPPLTEELQIESWAWMLLITSHQQLSSWKGLRFPHRRTDQALGKQTWCRRGCSCSPVAVVSFRCINLSLRTSRKGQHPWRASRGSLAVPTLRCALNHGPVTRCSQRTVPAGERKMGTVTDEVYS